MYPWLCVSLLVLLIPWENHAQLGGGSAVERLMSTLAYVWVEHCIDIAGCGMSFTSKISILVFNSLYLHLIMNYNEHVNEWNGLLPMCVKYLCICACYLLQCISFYVHGASFPGLDSSIVASSLW